MPALPVMTGSRFVIVFATPSPWPAPPRTGERGPEGSLLRREPCDALEAAALMWAALM